MDIISSWMVYLKASVKSEKTIKAYHKDILQYFSFCQQNQLDVLQEESVMHFFSVLRSQKKAFTTIERKKAAFRSLSRFLKTQGIDFSLSQKLQFPRQPQKIPLFLSQAETLSILEKLPRKTPIEKRNYFIFLLFYSSGLRLSELCRLGAEDIETNTASLRVYGKGGKTRIVFLPRATLDAYRIYFDEFKEKIQKNNRLFWNKNGGPLSERSVERIIAQVSEKLQFNKKLHPHALRHSYATQLLENGAEIKKISELLGHSSLATTQKYAHLNRKLLTQAIRQFHPHG